MFYFKNSVNYLLFVLLTSDAVPIKVHADYCRDVDTKNLQGEREW